MSILSKIFGDANEREINNLQKIVDQVNNLEHKFKNFSKIDFKKQTAKFKKQLENKSFDEQQQILNQILPEAFALVRAVALKTLNQRHYDVQLIAGLSLHQGKIAEMKTGEGKTLSSTAAIYLNALTGRGVHVVTVNDYLSRRDAVWMGQIYDTLGLTVGCLNHAQAYQYDAEYKSADDQTRDELGSFKVVNEFLRPVERLEAYSADITYGTNNEFGFDYLRDNMAQSLKQKVQRELHFAIIDEVDSILIDEARTPLIISAPDTSSTDKYARFATLVKNLKENTHYNIDEKMKAATLTDEGIIKMEQALGVDNIYTDQGIRDVHHIEQALKAQVLFQKDKDYVVQDGEVIIVDEFTGRLMYGRRYSEGLHQAIEAKEGVIVKQESITMATITFQNYFRMYKKLSGMTGTAATEAEEFSKIYNLDVLVIPTNKPVVRDDKADVIFKTTTEKYKAIVNEIKIRHELGQPVLVGTISIENNEYLSELLKREGVDHKLLNAKYHESEGEIIAQAGQRGAVTIATNMAGRGVDIVLGGNPSRKDEQENVKQLGGLHVIGTERHESRRIDNQLRGRSGRQGDPGSSQFFVSTEDDLMRIFGGDRIKSIMTSLGLPDDMPIENKMIASSIEKAQKKVEGHNFDIRKHLVEYDDVINKHREVIYKKRNEILSSQDKDDNTKKIIFEYITQEIETVVNFHTQNKTEAEWNLDEIYEVVGTIFDLPLEVRVNLEEVKDDKQLNKKDNQAGVSQKIISYLIALADKAYQELEDKINSDQNIKSQIKDSSQPMRLIEKSLLLRSIDMLWVDHIDAMDHMRQGIGLRGYGQKDPLVEYKKEAHRMFGSLLANIRKQVVYAIYKIGLAAPQQQSRQVQNLNFSGPAKQGSQSSTFSNLKKEKNYVKADVKDSQSKIPKVGRNDPCPCGATKADGTPKKYKHCHGK